MEIKLLETEVEDIIFEEQLLEEYDIRCVKRQVKLGGAGIVDILGWDRSKKCWVIVELKRDMVCTKAYAQGMRYRSWLDEMLYERQRHRQRPYTKPYVLLIGRHLADELKFLPSICSDKVEYGGCAYDLFKVKPVIDMGWHSTAQREYNENK
jgi:hypothetical protein